MNILFSSEASIKKVIGGAERVLYEQTRRLSDNGHEIHVITRKLPGHTSFYEKINNVHEWRYKVNERNNFTFLVSTVMNCRKLFKQISQKISFDLLNFHQPFSAFAINLLKNKKRIKKVYTCHSLSFEEYTLRRLKKGFLSTPFFHLNLFLRKVIEKFSLSKCERIIVLSQFTKDKLVNTHSILEEKISIIPGGSDLERFKPSPNKKEIRKSLNIPEYKFILLTVRNLVPRMGLENLLEAIALVQERIKDVCCIIGGEGMLRNKLETQVKALQLEDVVSLHGFVPEEHLPLYYQMADFFILPTTALEGFGLITVEAMACGTPVLGTPVGGTREILNKFDPGFLFKDTQPESMAKLIMDKHNSYRDKPDEYRKLSRKCRTFIEKYYSWEENIEKTEALFTQLIKEQ